MAQAFHKCLKIIKAFAASSRINILSGQWAAASTTLHSDDEFVLEKKNRLQKIFYITSSYLEKNSFDL